MEAPARPPSTSAACAPCNDRDLLDRIRVVSGISGGSLLAALWAYGPPDFADFDAHATDLLRSGLQLDIARQAFKPSAAARNLTAAARAGARQLFTRTTDISVARPANRTDALAAVLAHKAFATTTMADVTHPGLDVVLTATDLATTNAVRFGSARSGCSRYGTITEPIHVATAVAASAAYPALLPALERTFTFQHRDGHSQQHTVLLTDGGVYDNLGLSVLEPGRSPHHTQHVYDVPFIIACDAGLGELALKAPHFMARTPEPLLRHRPPQGPGLRPLASARVGGERTHRRLRSGVPRHEGRPAARAARRPRPAQRGRQLPDQLRCHGRAATSRPSPLRGEQLMRTVLPIYMGRAHR